MDEFDFVIVGGGSAGAIVAARLSEDPGVTVALIEAGDRPPEREAMPAACASLQLDPETDWMLTGDPGKGGLGFKNRRMPVPRGKMLGGSSGINYMVFVRGHPGDFDHWAALGAQGWDHDAVLPAFRRLEQVAETNEASIDRDQRGDAGRGRRSRRRQPNFGSSQKSRRPSCGAVPRPSGFPSPESFGSAPSAARSMCSRTKLA